MKNHITLILLVIFASCTQQNKPMPVVFDSSPVVKDTVKKKLLGSNDTVPRPVTPLTGTMVIKLKMDSTGDHVKVPVNIVSGKELFGDLVAADSNANIRFTRIDLPDSSSDGPYGKNLRYKIRIPGLYILTIGENKMAGDPWKGDFELHVWIK